MVQRFDLCKPLIAAVNGVALGGGFELALACDLIVAADTASFGLPEPKVGAVAVGGGVHRLVRQVGLKRAMGYLLTGDRMTAQDAWQLGLVNELSPQADLMSAVRGWCDRLLAAAPLSVQATKEIALRGLDAPDLATAIGEQGSYPAFRRWWDAEDTREGVRAFAEKRPPLWRGR